MYCACSSLNHTRLNHAGPLQVVNTKRLVKNQILTGLRSIRIYLYTDCVCCIYICMNKFYYNLIAMFGHDNYSAKGVLVSFSPLLNKLTQLGLMPNLTSIL